MFDAKLRASFPFGSPIPASFEGGSQRRFPDIWLEERQDNQNLKDQRGSRVDTVNSIFRNPRCIGPNKEDIKMVVRMEKRGQKEGGGNP